MRDVYHKRRDVMVDTFGRAGWAIPAPKATMFAWAPIPEPYRALGSLEFSKLLVEKGGRGRGAGIGFGEHGDDYVRIALVENEHRIRQAARNIKRFLSSGEVKRTTSSPSARVAEPAGRKCMAEALRIGIAGLGTVGAAVARFIEQKQSELNRQCGRPIEVVAVSARSRDRDRGVDLSAAKWFDDPMTCEVDGIDVFVELMGGEEGAARSVRQGRARGRAACRHRQQGSAAKHGVSLAEIAEKKGVLLNTRQRWRVAFGHQDPARSSGGQHGQPGLRYSERHLQLHPDPDGEGGHLCSRTASRMHSGSATPKPIRPSTSRATTPRTSCRS